MRVKSEKSGIAITLAALLLVAVFALALFASLLSIGADNGEIKTSRNLRGGLVSAGAPRSQLALKQMFDSMGAVRTNGNRVVYEPITGEYLASVAEKIQNGEKPLLSVEEVLYIISDSATYPEKYDGVKLHGEGTLILKKDDSEKQAHVAALEKSRTVYRIILYRIKSLCHESAFEEDGNTLVYYPDAADERSRARRFVFTEVSDDGRSDNIVFYPGDGQKITLYPTSDTDLFDLKYMLLSGDELSSAEIGILEACVYSADRYRNVTPAYWKGVTECKLVIISGRIIIVDPSSGRATDSAPSEMRTVSIAAGDNDGDGKYELYFTACSDGESAAVKYDPIKGEIEMLMKKDFCIGAYERIDGDGVSFYKVEQIESGSYLNLLSRKGDKIENEK